MNRNYTIGKSYITFENQPSSRYFIQKYNLPGFSLNQADQSTPYQNVPVPGSAITWKTFNATFILDEEMTVWYELWKWIKLNNDKNETYDFSLHIYNNTLKRTIMRVDFTGGWVSEENDVNLADFTQSDDTNPKTLDVYFKYAYYKPVMLNEEGGDIIEGA